jgi:hypothetical protein
MGEGVAGGGCGGGGEREGSWGACQRKCVGLEAWGCAVSTTMAGMMDCTHSKSPLCCAWEGAAMERSGKIFNQL